MSPPPRSFAPARSPPLDSSVVALALVSAIVLATTIALTATTALHIAWSDSCFQWLAATMAAVCVSAHVRKLSAARIAFASGVMCGALPSLWSAAWHTTDHWDDFMTWLPNALYLWKFGAFPTAAALPVASGLAGVGFLRGGCQPLPHAAPAPAPHATERCSGAFFG